ncbi:MAG: hypothetical protein IH624_20430 [Phycisphaerae bacterium]|nr:hypothetical protein [Phycisphaerae bacterium]
MADNERDCLSGFKWGPGRYRFAYGWKGLDVVNPDEPDDSMHFGRLVTNEVEFEVVEEVPDGYYREVYMEGWERVLRQNMVARFTDDGRTGHGIVGALLALNVKGLPFDIAFDIYAQAEGSDAEERAGQIAIKADSTRNYLKGITDVKGLTWDNAGEKRWRLIFRPSQQAAASHPPIREYYGREFVTDWLTFERSPWFDRHREMFEKAKVTISQNSGEFAAAMENRLGTELVGGSELPDDKPLGDEAKSTSAEAAFIIQKVLDRYAAIKTYSAVGELLTDVNSPPKVMPGVLAKMLHLKNRQQTLKSIFTIKMGRPNLYCIEWNENVGTAISKAGNVWSVGDGSQGLVFEMEKSFEQPLEGLVWTAGTMGRIQSSTFFDTPLNELRKVRDLCQQQDEQFEGLDCYVISGKLHSVGHTFWISKKDFLVRRQKSVSGGDGRPVEQRNKLTDEQITSILTASDTETTPEEIARFRAHLADARETAAKVKVTRTETYRNIVLDESVSREEYVPGEHSETTAKTLESVQRKYNNRLESGSAEEPDVEAVGAALSAAGFDVSIVSMSLDTTIVALDLDSSAVSDRRNEDADLIWDLASDTVEVAMANGVRMWPLESRDADRAAAEFLKQQPGLAADKPSSEMMKLSGAETYLVVMSDQHVAYLVGAIKSSMRLSPLKRTDQSSPSLVWGKCLAVDTNKESGIGRRPHSFSAVVGGGTTVELLGLCEIPGEGKAWWAADGGPVTDVYWDGAHAREGERARQAVLRIHSNETDTELKPTVKLSVRRNSVGEGSWAGAFVVSKDRKTLEDLRGCSFSLHDDHPTAEIEATVGYGPWQTKGTRMADMGGMIGPVLTNVGTLIFHDPTTEDGKTVLSVTLLNQVKNSRLVAIDKHGKLHESSSVTSMGTKEARGPECTIFRAEFLLVLSEIDRFEFQTRPHETVTFKNVSLYPGLKTDVEVVIGDTAAVVDRSGHDDGAVRGAEATDAIRQNDVLKAFRAFPMQGPCFGIYRVLGYFKEGGRGPILFAEGPEQFDAMSPENYPLERLVLDAEPLITEEDVVSYDWEKQMLQLKPGAIERLPQVHKRPVNVRGVPFVVTANGERIYLGAFWTPLSSLLADMPTIVLDYPLMPENTIQIGGGGILQEGETPTYPHRDRRLEDALRAVGVIKASGDEISLEEVSALVRRWYEGNLDGASFLFDNDEQKARYMELQREWRAGGVEMLGAIRTPPEGLPIVAKVIEGAKGRYTAAILIPADDGYAIHHVTVLRVGGVLKLDLGMEKVLRQSAAAREMSTELEYTTWLIGEMVREWEEAEGEALASLVEAMKEGVAAQLAALEYAAEKGIEIVGGSNESHLRETLDKFEKMSDEEVRRAVLEEMSGGKKSGAEMSQAAGPLGGTREIDKAEVAELIERWRRALLRADRDAVGELMAFEDDAERERYLEGVRSFMLPVREDRPVHIVRIGDLGGGRYKVLALIPGGTDYTWRNVVAVRAGAKLMIEDDMEASPAVRDSAVWRDADADELALLAAELRERYEAAAAACRYADENGIALADGSDKDQMQAMVYRLEMMTDEAVRKMMLDRFGGGRGSDRWTHVYLDGRYVRLVAVFDPRVRPLRFWGPEGTAIEGMAEWVVPASHPESVKLAVVVEYVPEEGYGRRAADGRYYSTYFGDWSKKPEFRYGRGYGEWTDVGIVKLNETAVFGDNWYTLEKIDGSEVGIKQVLPKMFYSFDPGFGVRLVAVDKGGRRFPVEPANAFIGQFEKDRRMMYFGAGLGLGPSSVDHFVLQRQPMDWAVIRGFAVKEGSAADDGAVAAQVRKPVAAEAAYRVTLVNGATIELLGVSRHPDVDGQWWTPSGRLLGVVPGEFSKGVQEARPGYQSFRFAYRGSGAEDIHCRWEIDGMQGCEALNSGPESGVKGFLTALENDKKKVDVRVGATGAQWETLSIVKPGRAVQIGYFRDYEYTITEPRQEDYLIRIPVIHTFTWGRKEYAVRMIGVTKAGKTIVASPAGSGGLQFMDMDYIIPYMPIEFFESFELQVQKFEWAEFKNVSLRPGVRDPVQVKIENASNVGGDSSQSTQVPPAAGDYMIVVQNYKRRDDLAPVQKYFAANGVQTEIVERGSYFFLVTTTLYYGFGENSDGAVALQRIKEIGARYEAPAGYESFRPNLFRDAYGEKIK